jgi:hypothetical protein
MHLENWICGGTCYAQVKSKLSSHDFITFFLGRRSYHSIVAFHDGTAFISASSPTHIRTFAGSEVDIHQPYVANVARHRGF